MAGAAGGDFGGYASRSEWRVARSDACRVAGLMDEGQLSRARWEQSIGAGVWARDEDGELVYEGFVSCKPETWWWKEECTVTYPRMYQ